MTLNFTSGVIQLQLCILGKCRWNWLGSIDEILMRFCVRIRRLWRSTHSYDDVEVRTNWEIRRMTDERHWKDSEIKRTSWTQEEDEMYFIFSSIYLPSAINFGRWWTDVIIFSFHDVSLLIDDLCTTVNYSLTINYCSNRCPISVLWWKDDILILSQRADIQWRYADIQW